MVWCSWFVFCVLWFIVYCLSGARKEVNDYIYSYISVSRDRCIMYDVFACIMYVCEGLGGCRDRRWDLAEGTGLAKGRK